MAVFIALAPSAAFAQRPVIAATGPTVSASLGYSYVDLDAAPSTRVGMSGVDSAVSADFLHRLGAALDVGYVRLANVFGSGKHGDVLSYLGGPVFYASRGKRLSPYIVPVLRVRAGAEIADWQGRLE